MTLTLAQLKTLLHDVTVTITGLPGNMVRHEYPQDGQPIGLVTDDVIYFTLTPTNADENDVVNFRDIVYKQNDAGNAAEEQVFYTRVMQVTWTLFGPSSFDNADLLRHGLLLEGNRGTLSRQGVYPQAQIAQAMRHPHHYNDQWWECSELNATFHVATLRVSPIPYLEAAKVEIVTEAGVQRTINISEPD